VAELVEELVVLSCIQYAYCYDMSPRERMRVEETATYPEWRVMATVPGGGVRIRGLPFSSSASAFFFDLKSPSFFALALPMDDVPKDDVR
jgi:hypothetical protein